MNTRLTAMLVAALVSTAWADDYWQFEKWLQHVHQEAPRHNLKLKWGEPTQEEFFYLYCWQSADHSVSHAISLAKAAWRQNKRLSIRSRESRLSLRSDYAADRPMARWDRLGRCHHGRICPGRRDEMKHGRHRT